MLYVVGFNSDREMIVNCYSGSFRHEKDDRYFRRLAEITGSASLTLQGERINLRPSSCRIEILSATAMCVPYVWFDGEVDSEIELQCPFVNNSVYHEYLTPVQELPGTFVPKEYSQYVGIKQSTGMEPDADVIITTTDHPMMYSKEGVFTNFPGQFPPMILDGMVFSILKGMPCLYPIDDNPSVWDKGYFAKSGYGRFLTLTVIAEQLGYPYYQYDDKRSVVFYTPFLTEVSPGIYKDTARGINGDPLGIGVDTVQGVIF